MQKQQINSGKRLLCKGGAMGARGPQLLVLAALPLLQVLVFNYLPMGGIIIAFKDFRADLGILGSKWVGFNNFRYFFTSPDFLRVAWNTLYLNIRFMLVGTVTNITLGILLYELHSRNATKIYQTILITPTFISWVLAGYMLYGFLNVEYGILNRLLISWGFEKMNWYTNPKPWPLILNIASVWKGVGMGSLLYYATLMGIDSSLFEAADIDGAGRFQKIRYITLPCLKRITIIQVILGLSGMFRSDFGLFYQLTQDSGALYSTTDVMDTYIFRAMRTLRDYGMSSAAGLLQSFVGFALILVSNMIIKKIDEESSVF